VQDWKRELALGQVLCEALCVRVLRKELYIRASWRGTHDRTLQVQEIVADLIKDTDEVHQLDVISIHNDND
jgi:hypothetical protein